MKVFSIAASVPLILAKPNEDVFHVDDSFFTGPDIGDRRYADLHAITLHYNPGFDHRKHWYYGCHCLMLSDRAMSTRGRGKPVDELDVQCKKYKECVHCAKLEFGSECIPERVKYEWTVGNNGEVKSKKAAPGTCKRALFECDKMYATALRDEDALAVFTTDYHGFWTTTGFDYKSPDSCVKRPGEAVPECCGGHDKPYFLYNTLNPNLKCCLDGTIKKQCPEDL